MDATQQSDPTADERRLTQIDFNRELTRRLPQRIQMKFLKEAPAESVQCSSFLFVSIRGHLSA